MADLGYLQRDIHLQRGCGQQLVASSSVTVGVHDRVDPPITNNNDGDSTMATKLSPSLLRNALCLPRPGPRQTPTWLSSASLRASRASYSTEAPPSPLYTKIREDLKGAMRAKDTNRLTVLRAVMAATLNASKTDKPIKTDVQLVDLLRKMARKSQDAVAEFKAAGREDLIEKEKIQQRIIEEYTAQSSVKEISKEEIRDLITKVAQELIASGTTDAKALKGAVTARVMGKELKDAAVAVEKKEITQMIGEISQKLTESS
ncbi:Yqey-like protein-domain-containing protein [Triangularia setosa]|uniref:Altered inheritance of mitochondria protein 41 n=1 Tax=Triangularia setosa TaxID=2587417 RepID=A0AAN7AC70_9PEZI|nr:Yqey-like protein-domain-containing protein [Podospora setosa]